jgi:hypothetical protein
MTDDEKRDVWISYSLSKDKFIDGKKPHLEVFPKAEVTIKWNGKRYGVFSDKDIKSGDVIEQVPALVLQTTFEHLLNEETRDLALASRTIKYPDVHEIFSELGHPMILPTGNFIVYNRASSPNSEFEYNRSFTSVVIRALQDIKEGEEISLRDDLDVLKLAKTKKSAGCSKCGKRKQKNNGKKENLKFKSMVTGNNLESIEIKENS